MGIAATEGTQAVFPRWEYEPYFSVPSELFSSESSGVDTFDYAAHLPDQHRGYLQDLKLFDGIAGQVWADFQPSPMAMEMLHDQYPWFFDGDHWTAVHVRRGDVIPAQRYYRLVGMDYYDRAFEVALKRVPQTRLLVVSDDIAWCREHLPDDSTFVSPQIPNLSGSNSTDWLEFMLFRLSQQHVITNSTFSWWAAWLSEDETPISPAVWFTPVWADVDLANFLPPHWTLI